MNEDLGRENLAFFTVSTKDNCTDPKEFARRWKRFRNHFEDAGIKDICVKVIEPQGRGALHSHCIVDLGEDVRQGFDFEAHTNAKRVGEKIYQHGGFKSAPRHLIKLHKQLTGVYAKSACPKLRSVWHHIRKVSRKSGFGRCETIPIKDPKAVADYIGGYLGKSLVKKTPKTKGMRKINYSRKVKRSVKGAFSWVGGTASLWRANLGTWAKYNNIAVNDYDTLRRRFGKRWAYHMYDRIMHEGPRERYLERMAKEVVERWGDLRAARRRYDYIAFGGDPSDPAWA
jgi:hypothetical protein